MSELLPCPFCGYDKPDQMCSSTGARVTGFYVWCQACDAEGPASSVSFGNAVDAWNRRASPPAKTGEHINAIRELIEFTRRYAPESSGQRLYISKAERAIAALTHSPGPAEARDAARLDWIERHAHLLGWDKDGEREVVRADDGATFTGDSFREAIDSALSQPRQQGEG